MLFQNLPPSLLEHTGQQTLVIVCFLHTFNERGEIARDGGNKRTPSANSKLIPLALLKLVFQHEAGVKREDERHF
jgi:hypothetical protein